MPGDAVICLIVLNFEYCLVDASNMVYTQIITCSLPILVYTCALVLYKAIYVFLELHRLRDL